MNELFKQYNSSENGLAEQQVIKNREKYGTNELKKQKKKSFLVRFLLQFKNLMVLVLLFSAVVSLITNFFEPDGGSIFEAVIIFAIVILNALIGVFQERKAENSIELLQKQTAPHSTVLRDGKIQTIESSNLVCGDIVFLKTGTLVPADVVLLESAKLTCNESSLTGESENVDKENISSISSKDITNANKCFSGTYLTNGTGKGLVVATGQQTELGKIAGLITKTKKEKTPLEKNIDQISKVITITVVSIVVVVFLISLFSSKLSFLDSFLTAIALAVAAIPESLPAVITIIMALGVEKLAKHGAIIKNLNSVETLGCCNIICTDKTGTLTQNKMQVKSLYFSGKFTNELPNDNNLINCLTLSNNVKETTTGIIGDSTEKAVFEYLKTNNIKQLSKCKLIDEIPFNSKDKTMSSLYDINGTTSLIIKGAFDYLIDNCKYVYIDGKNQKINNSIRKSIEDIHFQMASNGERVICYCKKQTKSVNDKSDLTLICLVGIIDPPRPEVLSSIEECKSAGIKPIMITGDHPDTAFAIAKQLKIATNKNEVMTGKELNSINEKALYKIINQYSVFARVSPTDKNRIVKALKKQNNIVAMTGDGANDAPSIKEADIGVAMGKDGSDVTKSVADLVITDDNYSSIVLAVKQGRTIYSNLRKTLEFLISTNIVEVVCIFIISLIMPSCSFLLPAQILFINLITDSLPAFALGLEKPEKDVMKRAPRNKKETLFSDEMGSHILAQGFIQSLLVLVLFITTYHAYGNAIASTISFLTICFMQIIHAINCKTNKSIFSINLFNNKTFNISFIVLLASIVFVAVFPPMQLMFGITKLNCVQWIIVLVSSLSIIPLVELTKVIIKWLHKK